MDIATRGPKSCKKMMIPRVFLPGLRVGLFALEAGYVGGDGFPFAVFLHEHVA